MHLKAFILRNFTTAAGILACKLGIRFMDVHLWFIEQLARIKTSILKTSSLGSVQTKIKTPFYKHASSLIFYPAI